jgi:hypothetical protein
MLKDISSEPSGDVVLILIFAVITGFLLFALVSALTWTFYVAREMSILASYTILDQARFQLDATRGSLTRLSVHGTVNVNRNVVVGRTGEGLADAFDASWI